MRNRLTRLVALSTALLAVVALGGTALAGHLAGDVDSYTGCLTTKGGTLTLIAEGNAPQKPCPGGSIVAHVSGGDITKVSVAAGSGLTGGGDNGEVTIGLDAKFTLPQSCTNAQVAKWASSTSTWICAGDNDTTYTAGTGLELNGTELGIASGYQLPQGCQLGEAVGWAISGVGAPIPGWQCRHFAKASQTCPSGEFARATSSTGDLVCAAPSSGGGGTAGSLSEARQTNFTTGDGIADDGAPHTVVTLSVDAGTYMVTGKGVLRRGDDDIGFVDPNGIGCQLMDGTDVVDETSFTPEDNDDAAYGFTLLGVVTTAGGDLTIDCSAEDDADQVDVRLAKLVALKVA